MKNSLMQTPNDNKVFEETILEINEYIINRGNVPVNIFISKLITGVIIRSISYEIKLTPNGFATLTNQAFNSIDELYYFIKSIFDQKKVAIQEVSNRMMKLILNIFNRKVEIFLASKKEINCYIINDLFNKYLRLEKNVSSL